MLRAAVVLVGFAVIAMVVLGIGSSLGLLVITPRGIALAAPAKPPTANATGPKVVTADELLARAGGTFTPPAPAVACVPPVASVPTIAAAPRVAPAVAANAPPVVPKSPAVAVNVPSVAKAPSAAANVPSVVKLPAAAAPMTAVASSSFGPRPHPAAPRPLPAPAPSVALAARPLSPAKAIRVCALAGRPLRDPDGNVWEPATGFDFGENFDRDSLSIDNTAFPDLYRHEHLGMTAWRRRMPNGRYTVRLHFCETWENIDGPRQHVFDVAVQGSVLRNFDMFSEAGGKNKPFKSFPANVTNGLLEIHFTWSEMSLPAINGIEVIPG